MSRTTGTQSTVPERSNPVPTIRIPGRGRICAVCVHPRRATIDLELATQSRSTRDVAETYGLNRGAIMRHRKSHLIASIQRSVATTQASQDKAVQSAFTTRLEDTWSKTERYFGVVDKLIEEKPNNVALAPAMLGQAAKLLEQMGRAEGVLLGGTAGAQPASVHHHQHLTQVLVLPGQANTTPNTAPLAHITAPVVDTELIDGPEPSE